MREPAHTEGSEIAALLGRTPQGRYDVVVRDRTGRPLVIRNDPLLDDGRPMPTRWWLVGRDLRDAVSRLESEGGVRAAEAAVDPIALAAAHDRYATERDAALPSGYEGPRPSGGVGGTRRGVKCLHAHLAWHLAGGDDPVGRWVADRLGLAGGHQGGPGPGHEHGGPVAAVDCGTNSTRLLVSDPDGRSRLREARITRLGRGVDATGRLSSDAVAATLEVLLAYRGEMDRLGVTAARASATSAVRDAANADAFLAPAAEVLGTVPEVLPGEEEGRLSYQGAVSALDPAGGPYLVVDIGGGSTELVLGPQDGAGSEPVGIASLKVGCVRLTERFLHHDPPDPDELAAARAAVGALLAGADPALPGARGAGLAVGLAGTVTTLAAMALGLRRYDRDRVHHAVLTRDQVEGLLSELAGEPRATRLARPGLEEARADVIVGGAVVLATVLATYGLERCLVSEADILDGMVATLLAGSRS